MVFICNDMSSYDSVKSLLSWPKVSGDFKKMPVDIWMDRVIVNYLNRNPKRVLFGIGEPDNLDAVMGIGFTIRRDIPAWFVSFLFGNPERANTHFSYKAWGLWNMVTHAHQLGEALGFKRYYYGTGKNISKVFERKWLQEATDYPVERYDKSLETIIPAHTRPDDELIWGLMGYFERGSDFYLHKRDLIAEPYTEMPAWAVDAKDWNLLFNELQAVRIY